MISKIRDYMNSERELNSQVFFIVLIVGSITALFSTVFTIVEDFGIGASVSTLACFVALVMIFIASFVFGKEAVCRLLLCLVLNFVLLPVAFFFCGGLKSGMTMYFISALYVVIPTLSNRKVRAIVYVGSLLALMLAVFLSAFVMPESVIRVSNKDWYIDVIVSLALNAFCIFYVASLTVSAYERERKTKEELLERLEDMSVRDELTGLYNRREMFRMMEEQVMGADAEDMYQVFMFDIDDFKDTNDSLGHVFGDKVIKEVSGCLKAVVREDEGEIAARYSGESFVAIFHSSDFNDAYARAEEVRKAVERLHFNENPDYHVTISGGVDRCNGARPRLVLRHADELLVIAKQAGKNQITRGE